MTATKSIFCSFYSGKKLGSSIKNHAASWFINLPEDV